MVRGCLCCCKLWVYCVWQASTTCFPAHLSQISLLRATSLFSLCVCVLVCVCGSWHAFGGSCRTALWDGIRTVSGHCAQTAVEQLFLIMEPGVVWIPTSANLFCVSACALHVCVHVFSAATVWWYICKGTARPRPLRCLRSDSKVGSAQTLGY